MWESLKCLRASLVSLSKFGEMMGPGDEASQAARLLEIEARHSFISYHVALHRSIGDAALQAGDSEGIVKRH